MSEDGRRVAPPLAHFFTWPVEDLDAQGSSFLGLSLLDARTITAIQQALADNVVPFDGSYFLDPLLGGNVCTSSTLR